MNKEIVIEIKTEHIQALLEGKKLILDYNNQPRVTLIPDRYGVFLTFDKFVEIRRKIMMQTITSNPDIVLRNIFGDDLYEKIMTEDKKNSPHQ